MVVGCADERVCDLQGQPRRPVHQLPGTRTTGPSSSSRSEARFAHTCTCWRRGCGTDCSSRVTVDQRRGHHARASFQCEFGCVIGTASAACEVDEHHHHHHRVKACHTSHFGGLERQVLRRVGYLWTRVSLPLCGSLVTDAVHVSCVRATVAAAQDHIQRINKHTEK